MKYIYVKENFDFRGCLQYFLRMEHHRVEAQLAEDDVTMATYHTLLEWRRSHPNSVHGYQRLCQALQQVNMASLIEVLENDS